MENGKGQGNREESTYPVIAMLMSGNDGVDARLTWWTLCESVEVGSVLARVVGCCVVRSSMVG